MNKKQEQAIVAMLSAPTLAKAASSVGVSVATLRRWRQLPAFRARYKEAQAELLEAETNRLRSIGLEAVETLARVMGNKKAPHAAKVSAARVALEMKLKTIEALDFETRLSALEALGAEED